MKKFAFLFGPALFCSGLLFAQDSGKVASIDLEKEWMREIPVQEGAQGSCYNNLRVDSAGDIWMIVCSDYEQDILYRIEPDGSLADTLFLPGEEVSYINSFDVDGQGYVYVAGSGMVDTLNAMAVAKIEIASGQVAWKKMFTGETAYGNPFACTLTMLPGNRMALSYKDGEKPGVGLAVFSREGEILSDSVYEGVSSAKCLLRDAAFAGGKLVLSGETYANEGLICVFDMSDYSLSWSDCAEGLMAATQGIWVEDGRYVMAGSNSMLGQTSISAFGQDGTRLGEQKTQAFVTGFGLEKAKEGYYMTGGGMAKNPYAEYTSFPMVSFFNEDLEYAGAYSEIEEWEGTDTYIVASGIMADGAYLAVFSSIKGNEPAKIYLNKYISRETEREHQQIEWAQELDVMYHDEEIPLEAMATSGLEVSFFTSDNYREIYVEGNVLKVLPSFAESMPEGGDFEVYAVQNGDSRYMPATHVVKSVSIKIRESASEPLPAFEGASLYYDFKARKVHYSGMRPGAAVHVYDTRGGLAKEMRAEGEEGVFDMSGLRQGLYLLRFDGQPGKVLKISVW